MFTVKTYKKTLKNGLKLESQLNHTVLKKRRSKIPENTELLSSLLRTLNIIIQREGDRNYRIMWLSSPKNSINGVSHLKFIWPLPRRQRGNNTGV